MNPNSQYLGRITAALIAFVTVATVTVWMPEASAAPLSGRNSLVPGASWAETPVSHQVFDLSSLSKTHRKLVRRTLAEFDFDWTQLSLPEPTEPERRIVIEVADISSWNAVGLAWPAPVGKIQIDDQITDKSWFRDIVLHELGHMVDFFYLEPLGLHDDLTSLLGAASWTELEHPFIPMFIRAFSSFDVNGEELALSRSQAAEVRTLLGGAGAPPTKARSSTGTSRSVSALVHEAGTRP